MRYYHVPRSVGGRLSRPWIYHPVPLAIAEIFGEYSIRPPKSIALRLGNRSSCTHCVSLSHQKCGALRLP